MNLLHYNANRQGVSLARVVVFGLWTLLALSTPLSELAALPRALALPTGILSLMPEGWQATLWTTAGMTAVKWTVVVGGALCIASGRAVPFAGPVVCIAATIFQCLVRSYGHVNHGEVAALLSLYVLTVFSWLNGEKRIAAWQARGFNPYTGQLVGVALTICIPYTMIGFHRVGLETLNLARGTHEERVFFTHFMAAHCVSRSYGEGSYAWATGVGSLVGEHPSLEAVLNLGFVAVTLLECGALLCLVSRRYRILFLAVMIGFHIGSMLLMRILFWENMVLYLFLTDVSSWWSEPTGETTKS
jgi:hypothetical protein